MDSSTPQCKYDVFISFRGEDTRKNFTDHLYTALDLEGFNIFRDHESLERGKEISSELLKAIEESKISIIIFSKNYASSSWCLDELVKIFECKEQKAQKVYPIFYNVNPSDVRKVGGKFKNAFDKHEKHDKKKAEIWRQAMVMIAAIGGWDSRDRLESELIQDIVKEISRELRLSPVLNLPLIQHSNQDPSACFSPIGKLCLQLSYPMDSSRPQCKYDVFISFRGVDTRKSFTGHLYTALDLKGFNIFRDHESRERGKEISLEHLKAIEESKISIIIFSKNYASSSWCLDELVKIVECMEQKAQKAYPIFYNVKPSDVRKVRGEFKKAFDKHEINDKKKSEIWRKAMVKIATIGGWDARNRLESELIQDIVKEISRKLRPSPVLNCKDLVGIEARLEKLKIYLTECSNSVCIVGICGMGGIGKTTIASVMYELISHEFEGGSFLANVREISQKDGIISLQKQLLSQTLKGTNYVICNVYDGKREIKGKLQHKKVLVVIDDVVHANQIESLAGDRDWFGSGSRIIITTRDEHLLNIIGVDALYKVEELNHDEALELFSLKACGRQPTKDHKDLFELFVKYASGLPLALQVLGSFLFGRTIDEWKSALKRLNNDSDKEILDVLQISFDALLEVEKKIFLDIACFFKGENIDYVTRILDGCGFNPRIGIRVLIDKSLITILDNNKLWMHDLLQEMGQQIVKRESLEEPGKRSRLWNEDDVYHVLTKNTGTEAIEGMVLDFCERKMHLSAKVFSKMVNLRLLKVLNVQLSEDLEYLSNELRLLKWQGYPLKSLPSNLRLDKTIELKINCSPIEQLWKGTQHLSQLKSISIIDSRNLKKTPDFTGVPNLEELILEGCSWLHEVHPSLATHKKLILLNLKDCKSLTTLTGKIGMTSLRKLILSGCSKFKTFPEIVGDMDCLLEIFLDGTAIKELPCSVGCLTGLVLLNLKDCNNLKSLPSNLNGLKSLKILNLSGCSKLENLPQNVGQVESLEELDISGTAIRQPESSIFHIKNLKVLSFRGCKGTPCKSWYLHFPFFERSSDSVALKLPSLPSLCSLTKLDLSDCNLWDGALPGDLGSLVALEELNLSKNNFISLPASINHLSRLQNLKLEECKRLKFIPELPSSINTVRLDACSSLETISDALKLCNSEWIVISCLNCLKLLDANSMVSSMLEQYLKVISSPKNEFSIVVRGSEIPEWFSHQSEGSSISIERPPCVNDNRNLLGYAVCSVFSVSQHPSAFSDVFGTHKLFCHLKTDGELSSTSHFTHFEEKFGRAVSDHLWLLYLSHCEYFGAEGHNEYSNIEFSFAAQWGPGLKVMRCGVHPIYEQEVAELDQTRNQYSNCSNLSVFHGNFAKSTGHVTNKRSLIVYDVAESRERSYRDEEPQIKRFR